VKTLMAKFLLLPLVGVESILTAAYAGQINVPTVPTPHVSVPHVSTPHVTAPQLNARVVTPQGATNLGHVKTKLPFLGSINTNSVQKSAGGQGSNRGLRNNNTVILQSGKTVLQPGGGPAGANLGGGIQNNNGPGGANLGGGIQNNNGGALQSGQIGLQPGGGGQGGTGGQGGAGLGGGIQNNNGVTLQSGLTLQPNGALGGTGGQSGAGLGGGLQNNNNNSLTLQPNGALGSPNGQTANPGPNSGGTTFNPSTGGGPTTFNAPSNGNSLSLSGNGQMPQSQTIALPPGGGLGGAGGQGGTTLSLSGNGQMPQSAGLPPGGGQGGGGGQPGIVTLQPNGALGAPSNGTTFQSPSNGSATNKPGFGSTDSATVIGSSSGAGKIPFNPFHDGKTIGQPSPNLLNAPALSETLSPATTGGAGAAKTTANSIIIEHIKLENEGNPHQGSIQLNSFSFGTAQGFVQPGTSKADREGSAPGLSSIVVGGTKTFVCTNCKNLPSPKNP
jgi:hypothetical protein